MRSSLIKSILVPVFALGLSAFLIQACGGTEEGASGGPAGCTPGATQRCFCDNGQEPVQTCQPDGTWSQCPCTGVTSSSSSGTGGGGGSTTCVMGGDPSASPPILCGNGVVDPGEQCDDGNCVPNDATCTDKCNLPICGDKIVQPGEDCDDGQNEVGDMCPDTCKQPLDGGMEAGDPCEGKLIFSSFTALQPSQWSYAAALGYEAGTKLCQAAGGTNVCDYEQLKEIFTNQAAHPGDVAKLQAAVAPGMTVTAWVNRTTPEMVNGQMSAAGPGGRCNDWVYPTNHISDGEYVTVTNTAGTVSGTFTLDNDTVFSGNAADGHAGPGLDCGGMMRLIPCCFPVCK